MKKLIVANWKMLPETLGQAEELLEHTEERLHDLNHEAFGLVVCPPFIFIEEVAKMIQEGAFADTTVLGAQDIATADTGAYTGEVSGTQLVRLGVRYVIIGHSERRWKLGESDEVTNTKLKVALRAGLTPIVCLGERTREGTWSDELTAQTSATLAGLTAGQVAQCIIAYEPVWAISTNPGAKSDTPASAVQSMGLIRETIADMFDVSHPTFLYGGSITPENASSFLERSEVSGVLVGGASVRADDFCRILSVAASIQ
jgi:triosephosphate isomerase (TIM)